VPVMRGEVVRKALLALAAVLLIRGLQSLADTRRDPDREVRMTDSRYSDADRVTLLSAVYQAERSDNSSIFTNALAMLGFAVAYVATVLSLVSATNALDGIFLAFAPIPACALIAYHQVMVGMNGARAAAAQRIERKILAILGGDDMAMSAPPERRRYRRVLKRVGAPKPLPVGEPKFGIGVGEQFLDPAQASFGRALGAVLPYAFVLFATLAFTWFMLKEAADHGAGVIVLWVGAGTSGVLILATLSNLLLNARRPEVKNLESA
jgi:hypothetical protein